MELSRTKLSEYVYERGVKQKFDSVLVAGSQVRATKSDLLAKITDVRKKQKHGHKKEYFFEL